MITYNSPWSAFYAFVDDLNRRIKMPNKEIYYQPFYDNMQNGWRFLILGADGRAHTSPTYKDRKTAQDAIKLHKATHNE